MVCRNLNLFITFCVDPVSLCQWLKSSVLSVLVKTLCQDPHPCLPPCYLQTTHCSYFFTFYWKNEDQFKIHHSTKCMIRPKKPEGPSLLSGSHWRWQSSNCSLLIKTKTLLLLLSHKTIPLNPFYIWPHGLNGLFCCFWPSFIYYECFILSLWA